jgi:hypothetical protein
MNKKKFVDTYKGESVQVGRPTRLNKVELELRTGKDYAELLFFGDLHYGHQQCDIVKAKAMLDWALENRVAVLLMGDLIEAGLRDSIGDSVYQQKLNPQKQMEAVVKLLMPLAQAKLIIGLHSGNHEARISKSTGIDIAKIMAHLLHVRYLGYACWSILTVGKQKYSMYSCHGKSGARFKHTKLKAVADLTGWLKADIIAHAHVHSIAAEPAMYQEVDFRNRVVKDGKCYVVLTGSYLKWDRSYAQEANYPISRIGSPKAMIGGVEHDVHFSL